MRTLSPTEVMKLNGSINQSKNSKIFISIWYRDVLALQDSYIVGIKNLNTTVMNKIIIFNYLHYFYYSPRSSKPRIIASLEKKLYYAL